MVRICGPKDRAPVGATVINTTSNSKTWSKGLSPFFLGPVPLYDGRWAKNVENGWQYSKVYDCHDAGGEPSPEYFLWAIDGWDYSRAVRYPMGKGAKPKYGWWDGKPLTYVQARKAIYIPLYSAAVRQTEAFKLLEKEYKQCEINDAECAWMDPKMSLWLWDFDGYDHVKHGVELKDVSTKEDRKMGHAFVLAMMLEGLI